MCRLWLPKASQNKKAPILALTRSIAAVQRADLKFYEILRSKAEELNSKFSHNVVDLTEERTEKINEIILKKSQGEYEKIDIEVLASSIEELIEIEKADVIDKNIKISDELADIKRQREIEKKRINRTIRQAASKYVA